MDVSNPKGNIFSVFGIDFAPLAIPLRRRLQTLSVLFYVNCFVFYPFALCIGTIVLLFTSYWWVVVGYLIWFYYDVHILKTHIRGGRRSEWVRGGPHMQYFTDYFPLSLEKTADISPDKNYLVGLHPHGVISCSLYGNFASECTGFSEKYPGITPTVLTLSVNFKWPILRGYVLWMGLCDVGKESIEYMLTKKGTGNMAMIVVGGAEEALYARPGSYTLILKSRKGFIKRAICAGASLVPCYSFGENDLYEQADNPKGSKVRAFQEKWKKMFGFSLPLFYGRGIFNYSYGIMPHRRPITTVIGRPIDVEKVENPSKELIDEYHERYTKELSDLFDEHKTKYNVPQDAKLEFV